MKRNILLCIIVIFAATSCSDRIYDNPAEPHLIVGNLKPPKNLKVSVADENLLKLTWEDVCTIEESFQIYRKKNNESYALYKTLPANTTQWQDNNVSLGDSYSYKIYAVNEQYRSRNAAETTFSYKLLPPSNIQIQSLSSTRIKISWEDNNSFEEGYKIDRKLGDYAWQESFATVSANSTAWECDINESDFPNLKWRMKAYYKSQYSENSAEFTSKVASPTFSPGGGSYSSPRNITISCATAGATIRYTTNGSTPTSSSTLYSGAIPINTSTVLKAKAFKSGWPDSDVATASYSIAHSWIGWCYPTDTGNSIGTGSAAQFDVAHRYSINDLADYAGCYLTNVKIWPAQADCIYTIKVWTGTSASQPSSLIHSQVISNPTISAWNDITLTSSIPIPTTRELWVGYGVNTQTGYPAGCDAGPPYEGKGNMMNTGSWNTLSNINNDLTYNWLIRCYVDAIPSRVLNFTESEIIEEAYGTPRETLKAYYKSQHCDSNPETK